MSTTLGSGTIINGDDFAYINDTSLTSGSVAFVVFKENPGNVGGGVCVKYLEYTTGSPANGHSIKVVTNFPVENDTNFIYVTG